MTKKYLIMLADHLRENGVNEFEPQVVEIIADALAKMNPRFKRERWIAYVHGECGPNGGKR